MSKITAVENPPLLLSVYGVGVIIAGAPIQLKYLGELAEPAVTQMGLPLSSEPDIRTTSTIQLKICDTPSVGRRVDKTIYFVSVT
jgi:hypothetical protein